MKIKDKTAGKNSFFNKIFLVYALITIISSFVLFLILTENLITIKKDQALEMSGQVIESVDSFLQSKIVDEKSIYQKLYRDDEKWAHLIEEIINEERQDYYTEHLQEVQKNITQTVYAVDNQFNGTFLYGKNTGKILQFGSFQNSGEYQFFVNTVHDFAYLEESKTKLVSARNEYTGNNSFSIFIFDPIRDPANFATKIGTMAMCFNAKNIRNCYRRFDKYIKGSVWVMDENGGLIYDSSSEYQLEGAFPQMDLLIERDSTLSGKDMIYNSVYNSECGYYVINPIPMAAIMDDVRVLQYNIFKVMILVLLCAALLNFISTKFFANRVRAIKETMDQVKQGKLTNFKKQRRYRDEVGYIHSELIEMCAVLDAHIKKEYVYQLRQKEMELYALQAQIDPHFLYNSLEAIRMNLYMKGEEEAGKMIWILSDMFRNIMKKDVVVTNRDEMNYVKSYLELYRFRLGNRMEYEIEVHEEVYRYATIKHILQPILENALVHGIQDVGTEEHPSRIKILAEKQGEDIVFTISDSGSGIETERLQEIRENLEKDELFQKSIGIYNVNNRLRIVYGDDYMLQIFSKEMEGTEVILKIKAMKKKELESYVRDINC